MKKNLWLFLLIILFANLIVGCGSNADPTATNPGPSTTDKAVTFNYPGGDWGYPTPFAMYPRGPGYLRMSYLFDTLTWKDENGVIPWLATDWEHSEDGLEWTFKLRDDVQWHDGQPLTADDVAFTYDYLKANRAAFAWNWPVEKVAETQVVDEHTVTFYMTEPVADVLVTLVGSVPILPQHIWHDVEDPAKFLDATAVIGSGPFKLSEYNKEQGRYIYAANPDYFLGKPSVDTLVMNAVQDEALALKTGTVNAASFWGKEIAVVQEFQDDPDYIIKEGPSFWVLQLIFNTQKPPFDDVTLRQAVAHAVDREKIVQQVTQGGAVVANLGILSPNTDWFNPDLPTCPYDPESASNTLQKVSSSKVTLITTADFAREAELVEADLEAVGLQVEVKTGDRSTIDGLLREGNFDLAINGHGGIANPAILRTPSWPAETYQNKTYDALFAQQASTIDETARQELVWQLQQVLAEDLPVLTLYHPKMWAVFKHGPVEPFYTSGGIGFGIPLELNKLAFLER